MVHIYLTAPRSASSTSWLHPLHQLLASSSAACVNVLIFPLCVHILMHNSPINFFFTNVRCSIRHGGKICHVSALFWFRASSVQKRQRGWRCNLGVLFTAHSTNMNAASCCCSQFLCLFFKLAQSRVFLYDCQLVYFL